MTTDHDARQHTAAMHTVDQLIEALPAAVYDGAAVQRVRAQRADLRLVRSMLLRGRVASTTLDGLAALCGCNTGPDTDGPEQDCPIHGDGQSFVDLFRWQRAVAIAAHAVAEADDDGRASAADPLVELVRAGPWNAGVMRAPGGGHVSADQAGPAPVADTRDTPGYSVLTDDGNDGHGGPF